MEAEGVTQWLRALEVILEDSESVPSTYNHNNDGSQPCLTPVLGTWCPLLASADIAHLQCTYISSG